MKNKLFITIYFVLAVSILAATANAQAQVSAQSPGRFTASFKTKAEPANGFEPPASEVRMDSKAVHRVWVDRRAGTYFGYDMEIEPIANTKLFRLSFAQLSVLLNSGMNGAGVS